MTGWLIYSLFNGISGDPVQASFLGAFMVALVAHIFAKRFRTPMIIFSVAGIIPLVPGGMAYNAMRHIVEKDYLTAISFASGAFMVSGAIAMGLVFAEVIIQLIFRSGIGRKRGKSNIKKRSVLINKRHSVLLFYILKLDVVSEVTGMPI